jgi:hypothetical protein
VLLSSAAIGFMTIFLMIGKGNNQQLPIYRAAPKSNPELPRSMWRTQLQLLCHVCVLENVALEDGDL